MVIRDYVSGHAAREYAVGKRQIGGVTMVEGLKENDQFPPEALGPIIMPTTKADRDRTMKIFHERILYRKGLFLRKNIWF